MNNFSKNILLTGAGFTHNFGTPLASGMWAFIFNNNLIQDHWTIRELLLDTFDYESAYYKVIQTPLLYEPSGKNVINKAILESYSDLDEIIRKSSSSFQINIEGVNELIRLFANKKELTNLAFTLNQDLFIERHFTNNTGNPLALPGVSRIPLLTSSSKNTINLCDEDYVQLPSETELKKTLSRSDFNYIKLHGSLNWKSSSGLDVMVIGQNKEERIIKEPLLSWYFELFKDALYQQNAKLLIIGYGFCDKHINEVILNAIKNYQLKIFIIYPFEPMNLFEKLVKEEARQIFENLAGFFPYRLSEIFPTSGGETILFKRIKEKFLE